jgi:hypothetical protein
MLDVMDMRMISNLEKQSLRKGSIPTRASIFLP